MIKQTTLCYIEKDGAYLMLHRVKKKNDENHDKWIGLGGKIEDGESPYDCVIREVYEEAGIRLTNPLYRGLITFVSDEYGTEYMHLFTSDGYEGEIDYDCDEGELTFVEFDKISTLPIWEGDKIFLKLLAERREFFSLKLEYQGDSLIRHTLY